METRKDNTISNLSSYSTVVFGTALIIAVVLDMIFPFKFLSEPWNQYLGIFVVAMGTLIVFSAENVGRKYSVRRKRGEVTHIENISKGVYSFSRNPKYVGLALLLVGLGIILNSVFVVLASILSVIIVDYFYLYREENLMAERHGDIYHEYKKKVRRWF
jgi:protein-S-isoprenylcysteine O-methyltransferase Ste14